MKKPILNKWTYSFEHQPDFISYDRGWRVVIFGIYKFTRMPEQGEAFSKKDYKGFIIRFYYWFPIRHCR